MVIVCILRIFVSLLSSMFSTVRRFMFFHAACRPAGMLENKSGVLQHDINVHDRLPILPITTLTLRTVEGVGCEVDSMEFDAKKFAHLLSTHCWAVLRLPEQHGAGQAGAVAGAVGEMLLGFVEESRAFFSQEDEVTKRALIEVEGGDRARRGSGYRDAGDGREQFHMALKGEDVYVYVYVYMYICMYIQPTWCDRL